MSKMQHFCKLCCKKNHGWDYKKRDTLSCDWDSISRWCDPCLSGGSADCFCTSWKSAWYTQEAPEIIYDFWWMHREMSILPGIKQKQTRSAGKIPIMLSREFPEKHRQRLKRFYGMNAWKQRQKEMQKRWKSSFCITQSSGNRQGKTRDALFVINKPGERIPRRKT